MNMSIAKMSLRCSFVLLTLFASGCEKSGPKLAPVKGKVTVSGSEPFAGGLVRFIPAPGSKNLNSREAVTDSKGNYTIMFFPGRRGLQPGNYKVMFSLYQMPDGSPVPDQSLEADPKHPAQLGAVQLVPTEYELGKADECSVTVDEEGGTFDFDIPQLNSPSEANRVGRR